MKLRRPVPNIVLIGFMGSGKSSVGRLIATRLGHRFVDTDQLVVRRTGLQIPELFSQFGEERFREEETAALESLQGAQRRVIATGGGIVTREANVKMLRSLGFVAWLTASEDVIFERVSRNRHRPLLQTDDPRRTVRELLALRNALYATAADATIDTSTATHSDVAGQVISEAERLGSCERAE